LHPIGSVRTCSAAVQSQDVNLDRILVARWVQGLKVDLNCDARNSSMPIEQDADDEWFVLFDFARANYASAARRWKHTAVRARTPRAQPSSQNAAEC
jgi:hypothetical protein